MAQMEEPADWAEAAEQRVLDEALKLAPSEGWTGRTARRAGLAAGLSEGETELLIPHGPADLAALLSRRHDRRALTLLRDVDPAALKVRERIRAALEARLDAAAEDSMPLRRVVGWCALPANAAVAARLAWESADVLWHWAGDVATDENHYSKRLLLAGILSGALAIRVGGGGRDEALAFVDRRIEDVMRYERLKAKAPKAYDVAQSAARSLGRLRYGRAQPDGGDAQ